MRMCSTYFLILWNIPYSLSKRIKKNGDNSLMHSNGDIRNKQKVGNLLVHLKTADKQILTANLPFLMRKQTVAGISSPHLSLSKFSSICIEYVYVFIKKVYCSVTGWRDKIKWNICQTFRRHFFLIFPSQSRRSF